jgi:hypothetical protein
MSKWGMEKTDLSNVDFVAEMQIYYLNSQSVSKSGMVLT